MIFRNQDQIVKLFPIFGNFNSDLAGCEYYRTTSSNYLKFYDLIKLDACRYPGYLARIAVYAMAEMDIRIVLATKHVVNFETSYHIGE